MTKKVSTINTLELTKLPGTDADNFRKCDGHEKNCLYAFAFGK